MDILTTATSLHAKSGEETTDLWWSINFVTNRHICSDLFVKICGIGPQDFTFDDFLMLVHPDHKNRIQGSILSLPTTGGCCEKFPILTKYGYRWVCSNFQKAITNDEGQVTARVAMNFMDADDVVTSSDIAAQWQLNELIARHSAVSESLMALLHTPDISAVINNTLKTLLDEFNGDRTYIFEYNIEQQTQSCIYEVVRQGVKPEQDELQDIPTSVTQWWTSMLLNQNKPIIYSNIEDLPPEAHYECEMLVSQNIQSIMIIPLLTKSGVGGYIGIDMVSEKYTWSSTDQQWFQSLSNVISLCIELRKSEDKAQHEHEHLSRLHESMPVGFVRLRLIYDDHGNLVDYLHLELNTIALTLVEPSEKNIVGTLASEWYDTIPPEQLGKFDELAKTHGIYKGSTTSNYNSHYFDYTIYSVEPDEIIVLIQDNTESILVSRALRKSEDTLENIYKNIPVGLEIYDKDGLLLSLNDIEQEIFGYPNKEDVVGVNLFDNPNVPPSFLEDLRNHKSSWCDFYYDFDHLDNYYDSQCQGRKHIVLKGLILYDADHNVENYLLIVLDNTDTLSANHKIHEFELLFNSIAEFSDIGLCQWNPCDKTIFATDQWYHNVCQRIRPITDIMEAYTCAHPDDQLRLIRGFRDILAGKINSFREEVRIHDGQGWKWLRSNYKVSDYRPTENKIEIIGINIDITELKNTELKLTQAKVKAEESDKLKSAFLANMSHEIRTPLNAIVGFSDLLVDADNIDDRQQYISIIRQNNDLLLQLISDILDISKIESDMIDIKSDCVDINNLCNEIACSQAMKTSDAVQINFDTRHVNCSVVTDKNRLMQVLTNLVGNAIKFTEKGSIDIGYHIKENQIQFHVRDSGIGIAPDQLPNIFTRFIKLNNFIPGTGLGLPICKSLIEKMGGKIWVVSEIGQGSCFRFTIPYDRDTAIVDDDNSCEPDDEVVETQSEHCTGDKPLILVAEDTDSNYLLISTILKAEYSLIRACDGAEAIELFKIHNPKLILMDMKMPNMNGTEATRSIKSINASVPIIMVTAFAFDNYKALALEAGCCEFITKPIHANNLKQLVSKYILSFRN